MNLDKIKTILKECAESNGYKLFDVTYHKGDNILSVLLDEKLNMDELEKVSNTISEYLDNYDDEFADNYFLDVSTVGVERPIRNENELKDAIGKYIYVKCKDKEYNGTLVSYEDGTLVLKVKDKNRIKDVSVDYKECKKVRYAVEF